MPNDRSIQACHILTAFFCLASFTCAAAAAVPARLSEMYGRLPLHFEANRGQRQEHVHFLARGPGYSLQLASGEAVLTLAKPAAAEKGAVRATGKRIETPPQAVPAVVRMRLMNAARAPLVSGRDALPGRVNYFIGRDPAKWLTNVPTYAKVHYSGVYPGIDLLYYGNQGQLEYDFVVAPNAKPEAIVLGFQGVDKLEIDAQGELVLHVAGGAIRQRKPIMYQERDGSRREIAGGYVIKGKNQVGFQVAAYDRSRQLIIDPVVAYATYLGGTGNDLAYSVTVDAEGNAYVVGSTGPEFVTPGVSPDAFVAKLNPTGTELIYFTHLGGSGSDSASAISLDADGKLYVAGDTCSNDYPTTPSAFQTAAGGHCDPFVTKLDAATASVHYYSTYLGGSLLDDMSGMTVDAEGNVYITGTTASIDYPITPGAFQPNHAGVRAPPVEGLQPRDAFVTKLDPTGSRLVYSTYLGGSADDPLHAGSDHGYGIEVDANGDALILGFTYSPEFPTTPDALEPLAGPYVTTRGTSFLTKLDLTGRRLLYSMDISGSQCYEYVRSIRLNASGNLYITGYTRGSFATTPGVFQPTFGGGFADGFVAKIEGTICPEEQQSAAR